MAEKSIYNFEVKKPNGEIIPLSNYEGKALLIVNTATKCGLAPQFEGLEDLHQKYKDKGLVILGFPSNQFLNQEPETNETMVQNCQINHGVTFQLLEKCDVNGNNTHPVFAFLKKNLGGWFGNKIKWNFTKFLIDTNGKPIKRFSPVTKPQDIEKDIQAILEK